MLEARERRRGEVKRQAVEVAVEVYYQSAQARQLRVLFGAAGR